MPCDVRLNVPSDLECAASVLLGPVFHTEVRGGEAVMFRYVRWIGLVAAMVVALTAGTAYAASVFFARGPSSPFGGTRFDGERYAPTNRIYFLGFRTFGNATDGSIWYYDIAAKTYTDTGIDMAVPISNYGIASLTDANGVGLYVFGGRDNNNNIINTVQVFYPATGNTGIIATDPFPGTTPSGCVSLPANGVAAINNKAIVLGGASFSSSGCVDDNSAQTWIFDPMAPAGSRWTQGQNLSQARGYITPAVLGADVYAIGGDVNVGGSLFAQPTVEASANGTGAWNPRAPLTEPCDESQAFGFSSGFLANTIILAGCGQWPNAVPDVLQYDAGTDTWAIVGRLNDNRRNHAGARLGTAGSSPMYILGGYGEASGFIDPIQTSEIGPATTRTVVGGGSSSHPPAGAGASTT